MTPSLYTPDLCHLLVRWVWTRKADDIVFAKAALSEARNAGARVAAAFQSNEFSVIPATEAHIKIARIAAAFAAGQFSTKDGVKVLVTRAHMIAAEQFLMTMLGADDMGLAEFCRNEQERNNIASHSLDWFADRVASEDNHYAIARWMADQDRPFDLVNFGKPLGLDLSLADNIGAELAKRGLLEPQGRLVQPSGSLRKLLQDMKKQGDLNAPSRPSPTRPNK
jgi:hypothetical protein